MYNKIIHYLNPRFKYILFIHGGKLLIAGLIIFMIYLNRSLEDLPGEQWKDIPNYEGIYQASNLGRIKSLERMVKYKNGAHKPQKENISYQRRSRNTYLLVGLYKEGSEKKALVHRLIAMAFLPNNEAKAAVNHKDGNKANNSVENLEWVTNSENMKHSYAVLGCKAPWTGKKGKLFWKSKAVNKLSIEGEVLETFDSCTLAGESLGVGATWISACCLGKAKTAYGFKWEYA